MSSRKRTSVIFRENAEGENLQVKVRAAEPFDAAVIEQLRSPVTEEVFGSVSIINVIEKALFSATMIDNTNKICGFAAFYDYPNHVDVMPNNLQSWLEKSFAIQSSNPLECVFLHYFVATENFASSTASELLKAMFRFLENVNYVYLCIPEANHPDPTISDIFKPLKKLHGELIIYVAERHYFIPCLHIRPAKMEDNDDLTPIFAEQKNTLQEVYGDFFVAELIDSQDECHRALCSEVNGRACGFISISENVNVELLNECFELKAFNGLRKPHPDDILSAVKEVESTDEPDKETMPAAEYEIIVVVVGTNTSGKNEFIDSIRVNSDDNSSEFVLMKEIHNKVIAVKIYSIIDEELENSAELILKSDITFLCYKQSDSETLSYLLSKCPIPNRQSSDDVSNSELDDSTRVTIGNTKFYALSQICFSLDEETKTTLVESTEQIRVQYEASVVEYDPDDIETMQANLSDAIKYTLQKKYGLQLSTTEESIADSASQASGSGRDDITLPPNFSASYDDFTPTYCGEVNAFCIQLFCIQEEYENRSLDFLEHCFDLFPNLEFCVITVPHLVPEFNLIQHFVRATPRPTSTLHQELYVFHRMGLLRDFKVRAAILDDTEFVKSLVSHIEGNDKIISDLERYNAARRDMDGTPIHAFVATCAQQIVGVAILRQEENIEFIRAHFCIEDFIYFAHHLRDQHGHLHHFVLNPVFSYLTKHFLKEAMRLSEKTALYYNSYPISSQLRQTSNHSLTTCLNELVPVKPRRQIQYPLQVLKENAPSTRILTDSEPYSLYHINTKLVLEYKVTINARIVVVGASETGLAFLEFLVFNAHLKFNNIKLVSPHGIPSQKPASNDAWNFSHHSQLNARQHQDRIALRNWVNVVYGKMTSINRKTKHITIENGTLVPYDHLVITTGNQYQPCFPNLSESSSNPSTDVEPLNLFTINDEHDATSAIHYLKTNKDQGNIVVYGSTIDSYTCINSLLKLGISGESIYLVHSPCSKDVFSTEVLDAVNTTLDNAEVKQLRNYELIDWMIADDKIISLVFRTNESETHFNCRALFVYLEKQTDYCAFKAMNDSCLVFDGRLVIDSYFHTNDVSIRAAGPVTKYARKYYSDKWTHACFNSTEVGQELALNMLKLFDPTLQVEDESAKDAHRLIPLYQNAKIISAQLPGGLNFFHFQKPQACDYVVDEKTYLMTTGSCSEEPHYFAIQLDAYDSIEKLTCYSNKPIPMDNLLCLYAKHQRYLNNMRSRYDEHLITDFYSFFEQSWAMAIFHDRFDYLLEEVRDVLHQVLANDQSLENATRNLVEDNLNLKPAQMQELRDMFVKNGFKSEAEAKILSFLTYNYYHLPMYAKPGMV